MAFLLGAPQFAARRSGCFRNPSAEPINADIHIAPDAVVRAAIEDPGDSGSSVFSGYE